MAIKSDAELLKKLTPKGELSLHFPQKFLGQSITSWYQQNARPLPWREFFKKHGDPYHVLVSEIMLQQTVIAAVIPKYTAFIKKFPKYTDLANAGEEEVQRAVSGLGYYRRFRMLREAAQQLTTHGAFPDNFNDIKELRGVGDYTASAVASICFDVPEAVVDGNVERVMCRLFDIHLPPNLPILKKVFKKTLNRTISNEHPGDFNQGIMEIGQLICTPTNPSCSVCPLQPKCISHKEGTTGKAPGKKIKKNFQNITTYVKVEVHGNKVLIVPRPDDTPFLKGIDGFTISKQPPENFVIEKNTPTFKHVITNHKLTNYVVVVKHKNRPKGSNGKWVSLSDIRGELTTSFDKKAIKAVFY